MNLTEGFVDGKFDCHVWDIFQYGGNKSCEETSDASSRDDRLSGMKDVLVYSCLDGSNAHSKGHLDDAAAEGGGGAGYECRGTLVELAVLSEESLRGGIEGKVCSDDQASPRGCTDDAFV